MGELAFLIFGISGLLLGAHLIIRGALDIAEHYKISQVFIGLTVLAVGTDLPELVTAIVASIHKLGGADTSGVIVGEVIGSCFGQIGPALGILGFFGVLTITKREFWRDGLMLIFSVILMIILSLDGSLDRLDGILMLLVYAFFFLTVYREENVFRKFKLAPKLRLEKVVFFLIAGFVILVFSSNLAVENAIRMAEMFDISKSIVGIFFIGLGTSLPEIVVSLTAIKKKAFGLSVGNLLGSNVFDVLVVSGVGSVISKIDVSGILVIFDMPFLLLMSLMVMVFFGRKRRITRPESTILILVFVAYLVLKLTFFA